MKKLPVLYSFRRCPYAIRARMALKYSGMRVQLREVSLASKPPALLAISIKGTVPVLQFSDGKVLDESLEIILWALSQHDPAQWLSPAIRPELDSLVDSNDYSFKEHLDHYKYAVKFPQYSAEHYRSLCEVFIAQLERRLKKSTYLLGKQISLADIAIFPFIRQFAQVDSTWFYQTAYSFLIKWLDALLSSKLFASVMQKYPIWQSGSAEITFPD